MSKTVRYKLSGEEHKEVLHFCNQIGLSIEKVAKQALFMAIEQAYLRAQDLMDEERRRAEQSAGSEVAEDSQPADTDGASEAGGSPEIRSSETVEP